MSTLDPLLNSFLEGETPTVKQDSPTQAATIVTHTPCGLIPDREYVVTSDSERWDGRSGGVLIGLSSMENAPNDHLGPTPTLEHSLYPSAEHYYLSCLLSSESSELVILSTLSHLFSVRLPPPWKIYSAGIKS